MNIAAVFSSLPAEKKAAFLVSVIHEQTIQARMAYAADYEQPDGLSLRSTNEFIHRIAGCAMNVLNRLDENADQDTSIIRMIIDQYQSEGNNWEERLAKLLAKL